MLMKLETMGREETERGSHRERNSDMGERQTDRQTDVMSRLQMGSERQRD